MVATAKKLAASLHELPLNWEVNSVSFSCSCTIPSKSDENRFKVIFYAGDRRHSTPAYKLNTPQQYGAFEMQILTSGQYVCVKELLSQVLLPVEIEKLGIVPGFVQPNIGHRQCRRILGVLQCIAAVEE